MRISKRDWSLVIPVIFLLTMWEVGVLSQPETREYLYKNRGDRFEGVRRGDQIAGEQLQLLSAIIKYQQEVPPGGVKQVLENILRKF